MERYGSTESFKNTVKNIQRLANYRKSVEYLGQDDENNPMLDIITDNPIIEFTGFVKLHGTNASIQHFVDKDCFYFCSRERILSEGHDNYNFRETMTQYDLNLLFAKLNYKESCQIYGEWCGKGIQQNVAVSELERMFVIFGVKCDGVWQNLDELELEMPENRIFQINHPRFKRYSITIDFNNPQASEELLEAMVNEVEKCCPVGNAFGVQGIGEGIVFVNADRSVFFKVKGDKHSGGSKAVKVTAGMEKVDLGEFLKLTLTEARLKQGLEYLKEIEKPISKASTPLFLTWVVNDIMKEEMGVIEENRLLDKLKQVKSELSDCARRWFFKITG
jgi:hypothetical protein